jgi:hypothetical protein
MDIGALSKIENMEVQVKVDKDFSVVVNGDRINGLDILFVSVQITGGLAGTLVGGGVENASGGIKSRADAERAKKLQAVIAEINLQSLSQKTLVDDLQASLRFKSVTAVTDRADLSAFGAGVLMVEIEDWGLFAGGKENADLEKVQVGLDVTASLIGGDGKLVWKHNDHFTGGVHHPIGEYGASPGLLKSEIEEMVKRYCASVANEIRYAQ